MIATFIENLFVIVFILFVFMSLITLTVIMLSFTIETIKDIKNMLKKGDD